MMTSWAQEEGSPMLPGPTPSVRAPLVVEVADAAFKTAASLIELKRKESGNRL